VFRGEKPLADQSASIGCNIQVEVKGGQLIDVSLTVSPIAIKKSLDSSRKVPLRRGEMMQVISNLISNSIYAMPSGGVLSVSVNDTMSPLDGIVLTVQDEGFGIAPENLPRVFDAFFTTRNTEGTGIGLFVAKQFVEGHSGQIEIESKNGAAEHGTIVRVFLPISPARAQPNLK
jgi:signal transduction histidine kinase